MTVGDVPAPAAPVERPATPGCPGERLTTRGRRLRLAAVAVVLGLLAWGSWGQTDEAFPVGPFVMYAFTTPPDGEIRSAGLQAVTADGRRLEVPLEPEVMGMRRAEIEGQLAKLRAEPHLLGVLADAHRELQPDEPDWVQVDLVHHVVDLEDGRAVSESVEVLATWRR